MCPNMSRSSSLNERRTLLRLSPNISIQNSFQSVLQEFLNTLIIGATSGAIGGTAVFSQRIMLDVGANGLFAADL